MKRYGFVLLFSVVAGFLACRDKNNVVPNTYVDVMIYTNNPAYVNLNVIGGWVYVDGGARGLIIYRKSNDEFAAYDRNCTYNPSDACATVHMETDNITASDTCCGSRFQVIDGSVIKGPAAQGLRRYQTTFDGSVLHVYNY
jgi:Rieske Fe-S protein